MKKLFKQLSFLIPVFFFTGLTFVFFWKFFLKGLIPIPADIIVGIYYPWRDHVWGGLVAGVPFKNGLLSDVVSIIYPWRIYGMELIKNGVAPLWIPHALAGSPLLANFQSAVFYPFNFLFFIFSEVNAWSIYIILQPILASWFCYLYLKNLKLSNLSCLIGAFVFAFSGFMMVWLEYGIVGHAGLWLPLILLAINKILSKPSVLWVVVGGLAAGFSILAGYPQISFFVLLTSFFYAAYKIFFSEKKGKRTIFYIFSFFLLGILLASVQLLPGLELWRLSLRQQDPTAAAFNFGLNPFKNLILFLAPDFYGNPTTGNFWGWGGYNESASYVSIAGLLLAIIAFLGFKKDKTLIFFKGLLVLSLLMVFANPLSNFIYSLRLPILASSSAGRFLFLVDFSLAILAAFGVEKLLAQKKSWTLFLSLALIFIPFAIILGIVFVRPGFWPQQDLLTNLVVAKRNLILPSILFSASLVLLISSCLKPFWAFKRIIFSLLFLLIVFDLFRFGFKYTPFTERNYLYPPTALTDFLRASKGLYRFYGLIPQSMFIPYNLTSPEGYEPLMLKRYSEFANQINEEKFRQISPGSRWVIVNRNESPLLNLLGAKYVLSFNPDPQSDWDPQYFKYPKEKYELVFQYGKSQVYENKQALPRAFIVHDFQVLNQKEILSTLMNEEFDPQSTLLLEEAPKKLPEEKLGEDKVAIDESGYFENRVLIKTHSSSDGFLFFSDNFYPGWKAFIDGKKTKIYRANYSFRAIALPAGEHQVHFVYNPLSFKIGLCLSLGVALLLTFSGIWVYKLRKEWW